MPQESPLRKYAREHGIPFDVPATPEPTAPQPTTNGRRTFLRSAAGTTGAILGTALYLTYSRLSQPGSDAVSAKPRPPLASKELQEWDNMVVDSLKLDNDPEFWKYYETLVFKGQRTDAAGHQLLNIEFDCASMSGCDPNLDISTIDRISKYALNWPQNLVATRSGRIDTGFYSNLRGLIYHNGITGEITTRQLVTQVNPDATFRRVVMDGVPPTGLMSRPQMLEVAKKAVKDFPDFPGSYSFRPADQNGLIGSQRIESLVSSERGRFIALDQAGQLGFLYSG